MSNHGLVFCSVYIGLLPEPYRSPDLVTMWTNLSHTIFLYYLLIVFHWFGACASLILSSSCLSCYEYLMETIFAAVVKLLPVYHSMIIWWIIIGSWYLTEMAVATNVAFCTIRYFPHNPGNVICFTVGGPSRYIDSVFTIPLSIAATDSEWTVPSYNNKCFPKPYRSPELVLLLAQGKSHHIYALFSDWLRFIYLVLVPNWFCLTAICLPCCGYLMEKYICWCCLTATCYHSLIIWWEVFWPLVYNNDGCIYKHSLPSHS